MAKQRTQIVMTDQEIEDFLTEQRNATVATVGAQGAVHLVAMWYAHLDGTIYLETKGKSQKALNLRRDGRMSFLVEAGQTYDQLRGVALEGTGVVVEDDPELLWNVCVNVFERYNGRYSEELRPFVETMTHNRVVVRLDVDRVRSWDHRKLGLPAMDLGGTTAASVTV